MLPFKQVGWFTTLTLVATLISGCAGVNESVQKTHTDEIDGQAHLAKIATIRDFKLSGRIAINVNNQGNSGTILWQHAKTSGNVSFYSPLGSKVANFSYTNQNVKLTNQDNKTFEANNAETLSEQHLGWRLPLEPLLDWILGRPSNGLISNLRWDEQGRISRFNQQGWEITYLAYQTTQEFSLPSKINIRNTQSNQPLNLRLVIDLWSLSNLPNNLNQTQHQP
jgi:outer membrane lipoprotein LolB